MQIIQDDNYMPMTVESNKDLEELRKVSLYGLEGEITSFPQALPFSQLYPLCCQKIQTFVSEYYMFSSEYMHSQHDVDEILRKVASTLLKCTNLIKVFG
jgi:exocyst complex component 6